MTELATVCIFGSASYRAGVTRGWERADRLFSVHGVASFPSDTEAVLRGLPYWLAEDDPQVALDFVEGFSLGFGRRVGGCWPNGMKRSES